MLPFTLIHTALLCEAQVVINYLALQQNKNIQNLPPNSKLFVSDRVVLIVSGIGKTNTLNALNFIFSQYRITKAINIGIAGCQDENIKIGQLFCVNKKLPDILYANITTLDKALNDTSELKTMLVDMESSYFISICEKYIQDFYVLKIVSDYCLNSIPKKSFVISLIQQSLTKWKYLL